MSGNTTDIVDKANRRLQQLQNTLKVNRAASISSENVPLIVLPDDSRVYNRHHSNGDSVITINNAEVLICQITTESAALVISAVGTPFENNELMHLPKYAVIKLTSPHDSRISIPDFWASIYALWTLYHEQEHIPINLSSSIGNYGEILDYLLSSGLGRLRINTQLSYTDKTNNDIIFLVRATFWQGAGMGMRWGNDRGWLRGPYTERAASFPQTHSFTRTSLVITAHPLRPPNPPPGECIYKRFCIPAMKMISFHMFDPDNNLHMETFHRWHNDERVHKGWGERGTMEKHRDYIQKQIADPHVLPIMMSWDDELMGYCELVWIRVGFVPSLRYINTMLTFGLRKIILRLTYRTDLLIMIEVCTYCAVRTNFGGMITVCYISLLSCKYFKNNQ